MNQGRILDEEEYYAGLLPRSFMPESGYEYMAGVSGWPRPITPGLLSGGQGGGGAGGGGAGGGQISSPTEPTQPTQPTEPTEPTEPTQPTEPTEPRLVATTVYPKGDSIFTTKRMIRDGPFIYANPDSDDYIGVGGNPGGVHGRNPFYNLDEDLEKTQFKESWTDGAGRILPSSYEDYIVPLTDIIGYPGPSYDWNGGVWGPVERGVIPSWYGLDVNSFGGYGDENKYWNTPEGQYQPDDFRWQYAGGPSFVEGAYSGPEPGLLGLDDAGDPYQGWIPGATMRGRTSGYGDTKVIWGPEGKGYWIEEPSDYDKYGFNPLPAGPPSSVMEVSEVTPGGWGTSWSPYNPDDLPVSEGPIFDIVGGGLLDPGPIMDSPHG